MRVKAWMECGKIRRDLDSQGPQPVQSILRRAMAGTDRKEAMQVLSIDIVTVCRRYAATWWQSGGSR